MGFTDYIPRAAIYARLSDEDKNKVNKNEASESIKNQISLAVNYAKDRGWLVVAVYNDDDFSGLDRDRPQFNQLLRDCESGKVDVVLCKDMSRFSRDSIITEEYLENKFIEWGVRFIGLSDGADTADKANKKSRQINSLVNMWYAEDISNKVRGTFDIKRTQGAFIGSYAPFGYKKIEENKNKFEIDPEAAAIVEKIFELYLKGNGTQKIANILNEEGILNPTAYKEQQGLNYKNPFKKDNFAFWNKTSVRRILKNETYLGHMVQNKIEKIHFKTKKRRNLSKDEWVVVKDTHEPIIDQDTFNRVQELLGAKVRSSGHGNAHLFAGKIVCKDCGSTMVKTSNKGYVYLSCALYRKDKSLCSKHSVRFDKVAHEVEERLKVILNAFIKDRDKFISKLLAKENFSINLDSLRKKVLKNQRRLNEITQGLKNLYVDKSKNKIDEELFDDLRDDFTKEKAKVEKELKELEQKIEMYNVNDNRKNYWVEVLKKLVSYEEIDRKIITELIDFVEVGEKKNGKQLILVHYLFSKLS